jgi:hypothetical protein
MSALMGTVCGLMRIGTVGFETRGVLSEELMGDWRLGRPKRCTLPTTEFLVTPRRRPISRVGIPSAHKAIRVLTRSDVQSIAIVLFRHAYGEKAMAELTTDTIAKYRIFAYPASLLFIGNKLITNFYYTFQSLPTLILYVVENTIYCIFYPHLPLHNVFLSPVSTAFYTITHLSSHLIKKSAFSYHRPLL